MNHNKYKPEFANIAYEMCLLGATTEQLARALGISERTFHYWLQEIPEFGEQVRAGREIADRKVAMSLYQKAIGWSHKQEKVFCDPRSGSRQIVEYTERFPPPRQYSHDFLAEEPSSRSVARCQAARGRQAW
jgi:hypothetical protein